MYYELGVQSELDALAQGRQAVQIQAVGWRRHGGGARQRGWHRRRRRRQLRQRRALPIRDGGESAVCEASQILLNTSSTHSSNHVIDKRLITLASQARGRAMM
jgi:hypothetical protein